MLSNIKVSKILQEYAKEAKLPFFLYKINELNIVTIYTDRPGILIGKAGVTVQQYENMLNELVVEENFLIKRINDKKTAEYEKQYKDIEDEHRYSLNLLKYEPTARIVFEETQNSLYNSVYDPMSEGF